MDPTASTSDRASGSATGDGTSPPILKLKLRILSSLGVEEPLTFDNLSPSTTVGELKAKIRESLRSRDSEVQRLIYRGRLLVNDSDRLVDVIGEQEVGRRNKSNILEPRINQDTHLTRHPNSRFASPQLRHYTSHSGKRRREQRGMPKLQLHQKGRSDHQATSSQALIQCRRHLLSHQGRRQTGTPSTWPGDRSTKASRTARDGKSRSTTRRSTSPPPRPHHDRTALRRMGEGVLA